MREDFTVCASVTNTLISGTRVVTKERCIYRDNWGENDPQTNGKKDHKLNPCLLIMSTLLILHIYQ